MNARRLLIMYPHDGWYHNQRPDRHVFNLHNSKCAKHSRAEQSRAEQVEVGDGKGPRHVWQTYTR
jgi:hypothetical protein